MAEQTQELVAKLVADVSAFKRGMDDATEKANNAGNKMKKRFQNIGQAIKIALAAAVTYLAYDGAKTILEFQQSVANLAAVTGQSVEGIANLKNEALRLGAATAYTATEVLGLQTELAKLGFREKDIIDLTPAILNLAQATGSDLANSAALAGSVVQSFGLQAKDTTQVVDIMTKSFTASALDITKFEVGIRQVAPVAKTANVSLSKTTAILGILANNGIRAETAGVGLRNILLESANQGRPFEELLQKINSSTDKAKTSMELFGKENAAVGVVIAENVGNINALDIALQDSAGTADQMAKTQLNTLKGSFTLLKSAFDGFVLSIEQGDGLLGKFANGAMQTATRLLAFFTRETEQAQDKLVLLNNEFQIEANVLKNANLGQEARKKLINKINTSYGEYLPSLITEKDSLEAINGILEKTNENFRTRIVLQAQEKQLATEIEKLTGLYTSLAQAELRIAEINQKLMSSYDSGEIAALNMELNSLQGQYAVTTHLLDNQKTSLDEMYAIQAKVVEEMGAYETKTEDIVTVTDKVTESVNEAAKAIEKMNYNFFKTGESSGYALSGLSNFQTGTQQAAEKAKEFAHVQDIVAGGIVTAFTEIGHAAVRGLGLAETGMQGFLAVMIETATQAIAVALAQSLANGILTGTKFATAIGPGGLAALPIVIGGAIAAVKAGFSQVPAFADGAVVSGPTMALVGEYSGARNNPEVIAPLDKLQGMIGNASQNGGNMNLSTRVSGGDLLFVLENAKNRRTRNSGF